ncbi:MAG: glycosyltransferase family 9 protein [Janthinobacterium lividum]
MSAIARGVPADPGIPAPPGFRPPPRPAPGVPPGVRRSLPWTILRRLLLELKQLAMPKSGRREKLWARVVRPVLLRWAGVPVPPMPLAHVVAERGADWRPGLGLAVRSILVLKVDHIGDLLLALPAIATLRRSWPDAAMTLMCGPWNVPVARALGVFDRIVAVDFLQGRADATRARVFDPSGIEAAGLGTFDLAVDLRVDEDSRPLLGHVEARFKAGYFSRLQPDDMALVLPLEAAGFPRRPGVQDHQRTLMSRLAAAVVDALDPLRDGEALLARVASAHDAAMAAALAGLARPIVAVNTLSGREIKNWPLDRFVAACRWITGELGGTVVLLGGPGDARNAEAIVRRVGDGRAGGVRNFVGRLKLDESFALLRHVDLYLGNDSGLTHAAAMSGVPVVAVFSGIDPVANWMPLGPDVTVVRAAIGCSPCHLTHVTDCPNRHACIQAIGVEPVLAAVRRALDDAVRAPGG